MSAPGPESLARLHAACFLTPRPWSAAEFSTLLNEAPVFLAGDAKGFVMGRAVAGEAEILTLAVDPARRREGRGRCLVAEFLTLARERNAQEAYLEVASDNAAALNLYAQFGFSRAGLRRGYYHTGNGTAVDAIILRKPLVTG